MFGGGSGGTGFNFGTSGTSAGFSFGASKPTTTATTTAGGISFGFGTKTSSASTGGGFGVSSTVTTATAPLLTQTSSAPAFKGLGGIDTTASGGNNNGANGKTEVICQAVQDQDVPGEICKDVKAFEDYIAKQKEESNEVGKFSVRSLHKISEEISNLSLSLATVSSAVHRNQACVQKLRDAFGKQLKHGEMAQRTQNIPPPLQHDNVAPIYYFSDLAAGFDESMKLYRLQIDELENHLQLVSHTNILSPRDIAMALMKMQETFVTLASNLHSIHDNVKRLKDQYLSYRRIVHGDQADIFASNKENKHKKTEKSGRVHGIPPFENLSNVAAIAIASMMQPQQQAQPGPPQQTFINHGFGTATNTNPFAPKATSGSLFGKPAATGSSSLFGASAFGSGNPKPTALSAGVASSSGNIFFGNSSFNSSAGVTFGGTAANKNTFDLKPPPLGNKRNKK